MRADLVVVVGEVVEVALKLAQAARGVLGEEQLQGPVPAFHLALGLGVAVSTGERNELGERVGDWGVLQ